MLFFIIPLSLVVLALIIIALIVWRKMSFLRKLTPESHDVGETWLHDMAPELTNKARSIPWHQYRQMVLVEIEKLLRRIRLGMSAIDRVSDKLVHTVRKGHIEAGKRVQEVQEEVEAAQQEQERDTDELDMDDPDQLRQEEQRLIVAIAQSPKDAGLYSEIARVYMRLHAYGDAVEALEQAVRLVPGDEQYLKRLERAKNKRNDAASATASV